MTNTRTPPDIIRGWLPAVLLAMAFLAPGAWLVGRLPPVPVAKALQLTTAGIWLLAFGLGAVAFARPDRRVLWGLGGVLTAVAASWFSGGWMFPVAVYDLFADMPLVQWLAFPAVFVLAAGAVIGRRETERAAGVVVVAGTVLAVTMALEQLTTATVGVFGSTGYTATALSPIIPLAVGVAASAKGRRAAVWFACAAVVAASLGLFSGSTMGSLSAVFAIVVSVAVHAAVRGSAGRAARIGAVALALAALMATGLLFAQIPALSGRWVTPSAAGRADKNVAARVYLWRGAQDMVMRRPVLGWGPSGYRLAAAGFLAPDALQYGPDKAGNIDPTVYSPQSPHSILWEIATRLGLMGLGAFIAMLGLWAATLRDKLRDPAGTGLRPAFAAAFMCAVFAMMVNPVLFPIGLLSAAAAGLAVAPAPGSRKRPQDAPRAVPRWVRVTAAVVGGAVVATAMWLGFGEWKAYTAGSQDAKAAATDLAAALRVIPGQPTSERRLLEQRLVLAPDTARVREVQRAVDSAGGYIPAFAPDLPSLAAYSLAQAERTGRTDVSWEAGLLARAARELPPIPSLVAERLHVAVLQRDPAAISRALRAAERWGGPYPYTESYIKRAEAFLTAAK